MVQRMIALNHEPRKAWSFANSSNEPLYVRTLNHPRGHVTWKYHVAPALLVVRSTGELRYEVIDPSIFNGPVPVSQWLQAQKNPRATQGPRFDLTWIGQPPRTGNGNLRFEGSGYWMGKDPPMNLTDHARAEMRRYKPREGGWADNDPDRPTLPVVPRPRPSPWVTPSPGTGPIRVPA
jgi:hypothetical protein